MICPPVTLSYTETIGIIDSGVGGLSVANSLIRLLPSHNFIYVADAAHLPYGQKSTDYLIERASKITKFLESQDIRTIVVACHTLSATALPFLKELFPHIQYVDMVPGTIEKAARSTKNKKVGVMATSATVASHLHKNLLLQADNSLEVFEQACPLFVPLIEKSAPENEIFIAAQNYLDPLQQQGADTVILGCTHYPFIENVLKKIAPSIHFISAANTLPSITVTSPLTTTRSQSFHFVTTAVIEYVQQAANVYFKPTESLIITYQSKPNL